MRSDTHNALAVRGDSLVPFALAVLLLLYLLVLDLFRLFGTAFLVYDMTLVRALKMTIHMQPLSLVAGFAACGRLDALRADSLPAASTREV